jgi:hypothetical protein
MNDVRWTSVLSADRMRPSRRSPLAHIGLASPLIRQSERRLSCPPMQPGDPGSCIGNADGIYRFFPLPRTLQRARFERERTPRAVKSEQHEQTLHLFACERIIIACDHLECLAVGRRRLTRATGEPSRMALDISLGANAIRSLRARDRFRAASPFCSFPASKRFVAGTTRPRTSRRQRFDRAAQSFESSRSRVCRIKDSNVATPTPLERIPIR